MAKHGVTKKSTRSEAPSKPAASAPSSGGTSAPGVVFDYCPTDFTTPEAAGQGDIEQPSNAPADAPKPVPEVKTEASPDVKAPQAGTPAKPEAAKEPEAPKQEASGPEPASLGKMVEPFATQVFGAGSGYAAVTATRLSVRLLDAAQANLNASFEFAKRVAAAKDLNEVLELQTAYLSEQFASVTAQTEEMAELARSLSPLTALTAATKY